jgi:hypothetical protein
VPDTAASRSSIVIVDFGAIWRAQGLPAQPTLSQFLRPHVGGALDQAAGADSPLGSELFSDLPRSARPFGYPVLGLGVELDVGDPPTDVSEVWGPIDAAKLAAAVAPLKPKHSTAGPSKVFDFGAALNLKSPGAFIQSLINLRFLVAPAGGGRAASGNKGAAESSVTRLANAQDVPDPVSADPLVAPLLRAFGTHVESIVIGTGLVSQGWATGLGASANPTTLERLKSEIGISRLPAAPLIVGLAYTGGPTAHQTVIAAALYPSPADAEAAVRTVGRYAATGMSLKLDEPYRKLWRVSSDTAHGQLVTMHLTTSDSAPTDELNASDFPLFWAP